MTSTTTNFGLTLWSPADPVGSGSDVYDHTQLDGNWDIIDAQLGRVSKYEPLLFEIRPWLRLDSSIALPAISTGWAICDGRTISSGQHSLPSPFSGSSVTLPDLRNVMLVGAATDQSTGVTRSDGVTAPSGTGASNAPGINGLQGTMGTITVPPHFHNFAHTHQAGGLTAIETGTAFNNTFGVSAGAEGSAFDLNTRNHYHQLLATYTSAARRPANANMLVSDVVGYDDSQVSKTMTTKQSPANAAHTATDHGHSLDDEPVLAGGASLYDDLTVDARPASVGIVYLMYVKTQVT